MKLSVPSPIAQAANSIAVIRSFKVALALLAAIGLTQYALAQPTGPFYPAPLGNGYSSTGSSGATGGKTGTYTITDPSGYSDLYWSIAGSAGLNGSLETLSLSSVSGQSAFFTGTTGYVDAYGADAGDYISSVAIELEVTLGAGASWVSASSLGLDPSLGDLADVTGLSSFTANLQFLADFSEIPDSGTSGYQAINNVDQIVTGDTHTSTSGSFYDNQPAAGVPDTAGTLGLISLALLGLAGMRRKFAHA